MKTEGKKQMWVRGDSSLPDEIRIEEMKWLGKDPQGREKYRLKGLALSGGGIRSATFNLGILQSLHRRGLMKRIDYLSTVSGGGYIGTCYTWLLDTLNKKNLNCRKPLEDGRKPVGAETVDWLRNNGNYLAPGGGYTVWTLLAAALSGILINLAIIMPVFLVLFHILMMPVPFFIPVDTPGVVMTAINTTLYYSKAESLLQMLPVVFFLSVGAFLSFTVIQALTSYGSTRRMRRMQNKVRMLNGVLLKTAVAALAVLSIQMVHGWLFSIGIADIIHYIALAIQSAGSFSFLFAFFKGSAGLNGKGSGSIVLGASYFLLVFGLLLFLFNLVADDTVPRGYSFAWLAVSLLAAHFIDINNYSMHRYYRDRLMNAFMPNKVTDSDWSDADQCRLEKINKTDSDSRDNNAARDARRVHIPFPILNTAVNTTDSRNVKYRLRGSDNFVFTPAYCGARSTGYLPTGTYIGGNANLATAMAISGAAVDPNSCITRSRPLSFLMSFFNIRLGYWIKNPKKSYPLLDLTRPMAQWYMLKEMLGFGLNEDRFNIHLSDGGHFENLGVYELLRRRCKVIIASDATADPGFTFTDLGKLVELARVDFGIEIDIDTGDLVPGEKTGQAKKPFVKGTICYPDIKGSRGFRGKLYYINTVLVKDLPADVHTYKRRNPSFPDQTTADQFFDEEQFEAYRKLGEKIGSLIRI